MEGVSQLDTASLNLPMGLFRVRSEAGTQFYRDDQAAAPLLIYSFTKSDGFTRFVCRPCDTIHLVGWEGEEKKKT